MPGARFFPDARLNFTENLLRRSDDSEAIVFRGEDGAIRRLSWRDLNALVSRLQQALAAEGVGMGDRVAGFLPNIPEAIAATLGEERDTLEDVVEPYLIQEGLILRTSRGRMLGLPGYEHPLPPRPSPCSE